MNKSTLMAAGWWMRFTLGGARVTLADASQREGEYGACGLAHDFGFVQRRHAAPGLDLDAFSVGGCVSREDRRAIAEVELRHRSATDSSQAFRRQDLRTA